MISQSLPIDSEPEWLELGRRIEAAASRDRAADGVTIDRQEFAACMSRFLDGWLRGEQRLNYIAFRDWLAKATTDLWCNQLAEHETAERWLSGEARRLMADEALRVGQREVAFILSPAGNGKFGQPIVSTRGRHDESWFCRKDMTTPHSLLVHSHPTGILEPSPTDLVSMHMLLVEQPEIGYGIISPGADRLYMVRDPRPIP